MPFFSRQSRIRLTLAHEDHQILFNEVIKVLDVIILCSYRGQKEQHQAFLNGASKLDYPHSKHNTQPSIAVDAAPYPLNWGNEQSFKNMRLIVHAIAERLFEEGKMKHKLRPIINLGTKTRPRWDYPHFELIMK